jgi:PAS domain S-box-containing protein
MNKNSSIKLTHEDKMRLLLERLESAEHDLRAEVGDDLEAIRAGGEATLLSRPAQKALLANFDTVRSVLNTLPAQVALLNPEGQLTTMNDAWKRFGESFLPTGAAALGDDFLAVCSQGRERYGRAAVACVRGITEVLRGQARGFQQEFIFEPSNSDETQWFQLIARPLVDEQTSGVVLMHLDISELRRAELRDKAQHDVTTIIAETPSVSAVAPRILQTLCDCLGWDLGALWLMRDNEVLECIASWNAFAAAPTAVEKCSAGLGLARGECLPGKIWEWQTPYWCEDVEAESDFRRRERGREDSWRTVFAFPIVFTGQVAGVIELISRRRRAMDAHQLSLGVTLGRQIGQLMAREKSELALRDSEQMYRALFDANPSPIFMVDLETWKILATNEAAQKLYGYSEAELLAVPFVDLYAPDEVPDLFDKARQLQVGETYMVSRRHRTREGRILNVEVRYHVSLIKARKVALSVISDVTERISLETQLRQSQKMESIGMLAGGVAHDFNNMLTVIAGYAAILKDLSMGDTESDALNEIIAASERAANLTRQLLTFSRRQVMQMEDLDLNEVVSSMTKMLRRLVREDVTLAVESSSAPPTVRADRGMLEQLLMNLAVNARDAMPEGGRLTITTAVVEIDEAHVRQNPEACTGSVVRLQVTDSGCGIAPENLSRIFEPFFTTKEKGRGTGLGLATVYGIVKQHGGWLEVASQPGAGTTFSIFFPWLESAAESVDKDEHFTQVLGGHESILVVEDEASLRGLVRAVLRRQGYTVHEASSGVAALEVWAAHRNEIKLLFTDMVMPDGMTGLQLAARLRAEKPDLCVMLASGYSVELSGSSLDFDSIRFLPKPFKAEALASAIRECLDAKTGEAR